MAFRHQLLLTKASCGALAGLGLAADGLRLRLSPELPAVYSTIHRGNAGQLLSS